MINLLNRSETAPGLSVADSVESPVKPPERDFQRLASCMQRNQEILYHESIKNYI